MSQGRIYRPGATIIALFIWAMLTGFAAYLAIETGSRRQSDDPARWLAYLIASFGILFGPIALIAHLARLCMVSVTLSPQEGLIFGKGRKLRWAEIRSIEHRESAFKGLLRVNPLLLFFTAGCFALVYYVVLPSFALFTPWHSRVVIALKDGQKVILRDLVDAEDFVKEASQYLQNGGEPDLLVS